MIITISGQYGSGGFEIAEELAQKLNYRVLDSELVVRAREIFTKVNGGEKPIWWPSRYNEAFNEKDDIVMPGKAYDQAKFKLQTDILGETEHIEPLTEEAAQTQKHMLEAQKQAILESNCILLGKCSNYVLRGRDDAIHVFTKAALETRVKRIADHYNFDTSVNQVDGRRIPRAAAYIRAFESVNMDEEEIKDLIHVTDERRASCYEFITGECWARGEHFDFVFDTTDDDLEPCVNAIIGEIAKRGKA